MTTYQTCLFALLVASAVPSQSVAQQYLVTCSNIAGIRMDAEGLEIETDKDAVIGATWVFRIAEGSKLVSMTLQNSRGAGGAKFEQTGAVIESTDHSVTIASTNNGSIWFYTLYGGSPGRLLVTQHGTASRLGGKMMAGTCR